MQYGWKKFMAFKKYVLDAAQFVFIVFVLWIYLYNPNESRLLDLGFNAILALVLFILGWFLSYILNKIGFKTLGQHLFIPNQQKLAKKIIFDNFWKYQLAVVFILLFIVGLNKTKFSIAELLNQDGFAGAQRLFNGIFNPNWAVLPKAVLNITETFFMAFMATVLAVPFAFCLSFFAAKNVMNSKLGAVVYFFTRTLLNLTRSIEVLLWAIVFSVWVGIGPFAGMLALMIHSIASLTKQYSESIETVSDGPVEAMQASGANKIQTIWFGIVPQTILPFISFTIYRWDINVRMATVIGLVGGGGIGTMLIQYQGQAMWAEVGTIIFVIAVVVWVMDQASAYIREALK
jgi:phosphonate transport system permease protein